MKKMRGLDEIDRKIVSLLEENPEISQSVMASKLKISQPAVHARLKRLRNHGIITHVVGINLNRVNLYMAKVDMTAKDPWKVLDFFKKCPMYINGFVTSGKYNLCLFFISEKLSAIESCINFHIRKNPNVTDVEFNVVITTAKDFVVPIKLWSEKKRRSPCGRRCTEEPCYSSGKCLGCPATIFYKGNIL
ncbi:Lrp/AsnC family transcriptional regulator [Candidatus Bathyarchaeota archaeon]|nr:Lrp/AsnC family transcriptional regulator [Candidatus Bathyarchaeota archaeon]